MGLVTKGLLPSSSSSLIDDDGVDDKLFDPISSPKVLSEVLDCCEFSSPLSCVTINEENKIVRLMIHLDGLGDKRTLQSKSLMRSSISPPYSS